MPDGVQKPIAAAIVQPEPIAAAQMQRIAGVPLWLCTTRRRHEVVIAAVAAGGVLLMGGRVCYT